MTEQQKQTTTKSTSVLHQQQTKFRKYFFITTLLISLTLLIALLAMVMSFYNWQKLRHNHIAIREYLSKTQLLQTDFKTQLENLTKDLVMVQTNFSQIKNNLNLIIQQNTNQDLHWNLVEVYYKLRLANLNLRFTHDIEAGKALLQAVDDQLAALTNSALSPLRQAVAMDIAKLNALPKLDLPGLLMQINAIIDQIKSLTIITNAGAVVQTDPENLQEHGWRMYWHKTLQTLAKIVVVRKYNQNAIPILTPDQQANLDAVVMQTLTQAELAAMQSNTKMYEISLSQAQRLIETYYTDSTARQSILQTIIQLKSQTVSLTVPDLITTIQLTQQLIKESEKK